MQEQQTPQEDLVGSARAASDIQLEKHSPDKPDEMEIDAAAEAPEEEAPPPEDKVFGMPRFQFHTTALGAGIGIILAGLLHIDGMSMPGLTGMFVGWTVGWAILKRRRKQDENARDAE